MSADSSINVEVVYADSEKQTLLRLKVPEEVTVQEVIESSGILELFPAIDLSTQKVGIFSQLCSLDKIVEEGDRVEIYRPLILDPKQARLKRVVKKVKKVQFN